MKRIVLGCLFVALSFQMSAGYAQSLEFIELEGGHIDYLIVGDWSHPYVFGCSGRSGIWRLDLQTEQWERVVNGFPLQYEEPEVIYDNYINFAVSSRHEGLVLVNAVCAGLCRTMDSGENWAVLGDPLDQSWVYAMAISPEDPNKYYVATKYPDQILVTEDGGETWDVLEDIPPAPFLFDPADDQHMFIGYYESHDGGDTWEQLAVPEDLQEYEVWRLGMSANDDGDFYAILLHGEMGMKKLYRYHTSTASWEYLRWASSLFVSERGTVISRYEDPYVYSEDGGQNWLPLEWSDDGRRIDKKGTVLDIAFLPTDEERLIVSTNATVFVTDPGMNNLTEMENNLTLFPAQCNVAIGEGADAILYCGGSAGLLRSDDDGQTWRRLHYQPVTALACAENGRVYASITGHHNNIYVSDDYGETYIPSENDFRNNSRCNFVIHPDDPDIAWYRIESSDSSVVYHTTDGGHVWNIQKTNDSYQSYLCLSNETVPTLYLTGWGLEKSTDWGETWETIETPTLNVPYCFVLAGYDGDHSILLSNSHIYIKYNHEENEWEDYYDGLSADAKFYATMFKGMLLTRVGSNQIWKIAPGDESVWSLYYTLPERENGYGSPTNLDTNRLFHAIMGGICIYDETDTVVQDEENPVETFLLAEAYPNPFNSQITIRCNVLDRAATIRVYNALGQMVDQIPTNGVQDAVVWSPRVLSSGRYYITIQNLSDTFVLPVTYVR